MDQSFSLFSPGQAPNLAGAIKGKQGVNYPALRILGEGSQDAKGKAPAAVTVGTEALRGRR